MTSYTQQTTLESFPEATTTGNVNYLKDYSAEKVCRKRKHSDVPSDNFNSSGGTENTTTLLLPPTSNALTPCHQEPSFTNSYISHNQYGVMPQFFPYYPPQSRLYTPFTQGDSVPYVPSTSEHINSVQQPILPENSMYGMQPSPYYCPTNSKQVIRLTSCTLYPPSPSYKSTRNVKPSGCRTVFVGNLPGKISEDIIREVFSTVGKIVTVRMNAKMFCHVRFSCQEEVEQALFLSGYQMKIENKDEASYSGRIHVDYAVAKDDQHEAECAERLALRKARHLIQKEQEALEIHKPRLHPFSEVELHTLMIQFRNGSFKGGINTLNSWLQKGEVEKRNSGKFFTIIQSLYHNIKKLLSEKQTYEDSNKKAKLLHKQKVAEISSHLDYFGNLFNLAESRNNWDHFSKSERKNIELWKKQTSEIKMANGDQLLDEKIEDESEVCNEESKDSSIVEEVKLLQKQISEVESSIASLEENIITIEKERDLGSKALSQNLKSHQMNLKSLKEDYQYILPLHKRAVQIIAKGKKPNPITPPKSSNSIEDIRKEACILALVGQFLIVHPFAVNINYICSYLDKIVPRVSTVYVTNLMRRFPTVFKESISGIGATLERKWSFNLV